MKIRPELEITVRHYSLLNVFKCMVHDVQESAVVIKLPKECLRTSFLKGDPLVVAYEMEGLVQIMGGNIIDFSHNEEQLIFVADVQDSDARMRACERFPVSLYSDFKLAEGVGVKKCYALVKDISIYGMKIYARESYFKGQKIYLDIFLTRDIMSMTAEIVRKVEYEGYIEYGLKIMHNGPTVLNHIKSFVRKSQQEHMIKFYRQ